MQGETICNQITLIGLGLIGGSLAQALRRENAVTRIVGHTATKATADYALNHNIVDAIEENVQDAVAEADIVVICTPISTFSSIVWEIAPHLKRGAIVTDVASAKGFIGNKIAPFFQRSQLPSVVPAHPIAGKESSGIAASESTLFQGTKTIITPLKETQTSAIETVRKLWQRCGAKVEQMDAAEHDKIFGGVSHLPQSLAFCLAHTLHNYEAPAIEGVTAQACKTLQRFMRLTHSPGKMWHDIFFSNQASLVSFYGRFQYYLQQTINDFETNPKHLTERLTYSKKLRLSLETSPGSHPADDREFHSLLYSVGKGSEVVATSILITSALVESTRDVLEYGGSGYKDFTAPLLQYSPKMADLFLEHKSLMMPFINTFKRELAQLHGFIQLENLDACASYLNVN